MANWVDPYEVVHQEAISSESTLFAHVSVLESSKKAKVLLIYMCVMKAYISLYIRAVSLTESLHYGNKSIQIY